VIDSTRRTADHPCMNRRSALLPQLVFAMPGPGGYMPYGVPPGPYGPPGRNPGYPVPPPVPIRQTHTMAVVSLIAGIVSWFGCPFVGGLVALITGAMARKTIRAEPQRWDGDALAVAGMVVGGVNLAIWTIVGLLYLLMILGVVSAAILGS